MKLKDYVIPQYGPDDGLGEDLDRYNLKNFDLSAYQLPQEQPDLAPTPAPWDPTLFNQESDSASPVAAAQAPPSPNPLDVDPWSSTREQPDHHRFSPAPSPPQAELNPPAPHPWEGKFGPHFDLQTVSYAPLSPAQSWKIPRWVVTTVGLFFGSAAVLTIACCVVLLRDPKAAPTEQLAAPAAAVATTSAAPAPRSASSPREAGSDPARAASAPGHDTTTNRPLADRAAVRHPAAANVMHDDPAPGHRAVVSRQPSVVRRQVYRSRRVASKSESSSLAPEESETASRRPPPDALDKLLGESAL